MELFRRISSLAANVRTEPVLHDGGSAALGSSPPASVPKFETWRAQTELFQDVAGYDFSGPGLNLTGGAYPEQIKGLHVTVDFFRLFAARIAMGRAFTPEEDARMDRTSPC